jgi:hypothetical protein
MILYEVKLICPKTNEVLFTAVDKKPKLPAEELYRRIPKPLLVITLKAISD